MAALLIGYARCSTDQQDLTAQHDGLTALGVSPTRIYVDHGLTGTTRDRPGLREALAACREGDTLVVTKLDRLPRSLPDPRAIPPEPPTHPVRLRPRATAVASATRGANRSLLTMWRSARRVPRSSVPITNRQTGGRMLLAKPALKWSLLAGTRQARPAVPSWWRGTSARSAPAGAASCFFEPRFSLSWYLTTMRRCSRIRRPRLSRCRYTFTPARRAPL